MIDVVASLGFTLLFAASPTVSVEIDTPAAGDDAAPPTSPAEGVAAPSSDDDDPSVVIRPHDGHWGMHFGFGGLAPMSIGGLNDVNAGRLMFTELGVRRAFRNGWALPFSVGVGWAQSNPDEGETENAAGVSASIGVRKSFRVWRRIAPYTGGDVRVTYADPEGADNRLVALSFGPNLGIEYFIADRVSLLLQGDLTLALSFSEVAVETDLGTHVSGGGQMGLVFYF